MVMIGAIQPTPRGNAAPLRVARWCRVSTEEQSKEGRAGVQRQYDQTDRIILANGHHLVASFDVIVSGASVAQTPQFKELLRLVQAAEIQAVIVSEVSRLMRVDSWESLAVLDIFARHRVLIIADGVQIDFSNPEGFLTGGIQTLLAGHERMKLVQKIHAAKEVIKRQGRLASGEQTLPYAVSYDWKARKFYYDQERIWRVQEAYRLIDEEGLYNISDVAKQVGFNRTSVRVILSNPIYIGIRRYATKIDPDSPPISTSALKKYRRRIPCEPHEIVEIKVIDEPAVSPDRFRRVTAILEEMRANRVARRPKEGRVHLCTGYGRCGYCGEKLYFGSKRHNTTNELLIWYCCRSQHPGKKAGRIRCANSWVSDRKLDPLLLAFCRSVLTDPAFLSRLIADSVQRSSVVIAQFPKSEHQRSITKLENSEKRLIEMCRDGAISISELKKERAKIRAEIARLGQQISKADTPEGARTLEDFARLLVKGAYRFANLTDQREQKAMLEQIFSDIFFRDESITAFRFHPGFAGMLGENGKAFRETVHLEKPFRITQEIPKGHKKCSKCGVILPTASFPPLRSRCPECHRKSERERQRRYEEGLRARGISRWKFSERNRKRREAAQRESGDAGEVACVT